MGCDIHMFVEYDPGNGRNWLSIRPTGWWNKSGEWEIHRDYTMFAALSGVKGEPGERSSILTRLKDKRDTWWPRNPDTGWVITGTDSTRALAAMSRDAHHEGWVTFSEVMDYVKAYPDSRLALSQILDLFEHLEVERKLGHLLDNIRLVFFYDN